MMFSPDGGKASLQGKSSQVKDHHIDFVKLRRPFTCWLLPGLRLVHKHDVTVRRPVPERYSRGFRRVPIAPNAGNATTAPGVNADRWRRPPLVRYGFKVRSGKTKDMDFSTTTMQCLGRIQTEP